ncbi:hypothetical protein ASF57_18235 [Methylobacterium sp. Leaf117]|nr:hypothetical protein ASF57_18235 [Methylobacterium sp. Leaf117]
MQAFAIGARLQCRAHADHVLAVAWVVEREPGQKGVESGRRDDAGPGGGALTVAQGGAVRGSRWPAA